MRYQKHLTSEQLIALFDGELNLFSRFLAKIHLALCGECRQQASELKGTIRLASLLSSPNEEKLQKSKDCLDDETIADYVAYQLSQEDRVAVENHLASCHYCLNEVAQLHSTVRLWDAGKLSKAPRQILQSLKEPVSTVEESKEPWGRRFLSLFSPKAQWIPVGVSIGVCFLIAIIILSILYVSQDGTIQTASDIQGAFTYLAQSEGTADALQPLIYTVDLSHSMDKITRGIIESESIPSSTKYFLSGVCVASSYLSISKMNENENLKQYSVSFLTTLETLLNEPNTAALSKASSELRARAESGLYSGSDLTPLVLELSNSIEEIAKSKRTLSHFLFGQWLVALSTQAELAAMTPDDENLRRELDKLLRSETIQFFKSHLNTTSSEEQQQLVSVLSSIEELFAKWNNTQEGSNWRKIATEVQKSISIYLQ
jgi:hypothetical protein